VANLDEASKNLAELSKGFTGEGLIPRLVNDEEYASKTLVEFQQLTERLNEVSRQLAEGDGTAGRIIQDPAIYESINDILIGINESAMLRWLVKRSQSKGIEKRYEAEQKSGESQGNDVPATEDVPAVEPLVPVEPDTEEPPSGMGASESEVPAPAADPDLRPTETEETAPVAPPIDPVAEQPAAVEPGPEEDVAPIEPETIEQEELPPTTPEKKPEETPPPVPPQT